MKIMTYTDGMESLRGQSPELVEVVRSQTSMHSRCFKLPSDSGEMTALARFLAKDVFTGKAVAIHVAETDIWSSSQNKFLFDTFVSAAVEGVSSDASPSVDDFDFYLLRPDENDFLEGIIALSLYFHWGVTLIEPEQQAVIATSHDDYVCVVSPKAEICRQYAAELEQFGLVEIEERLLPQKVRVSH